MADTSKEMLDLARAAAKARMNTDQRRKRLIEMQNQAKLAHKKPGKQKFEVKGPDGHIFEIEADSAEQAARDFQNLSSSTTG